ncbi:hypothetical protein KDK95_29195 [Actinospica sp. MGRD01-02]|uniref:Uncharacterized protein n=1 Tax=Actinospica acidithermotolerans TaxID=2828514 RepID=A0A941ILW1_9ACTN|nr:hypothetical protein [Actinospica acidithermotolerans]MBR7830412.1 hypothetical protein [Actinospica acidithermotolerans]
MTLTRSLLEQACTLLHHAGEISHVEIGITVPQLLLLTPDHTAEVIVMPGGIPNADGSAGLRRHAKRIAAVAAAYTVECWLGYVSKPLSVFERFAPDDLPRAGDVDDRREAVATTAVWPGGHLFVHRVTVIARTPGGSVLGPACWMKPRDYDTNWWLESLITPP